MLAHEWVYLSKISLKYGMPKYGKHESDGVWSIKWMRSTMVDEMIEIG